MRHRLRLRASLFVVALAFFALTAEGGLRFYAHCCSLTRGGLSKASLPDPVLGYRLRPNLSARVSMPELEFEFTFETGPDGFRPTPSTAKSGAAPYKILVLGDSFTFGLGVESDETYAAELTRILAEQHAGPVDVLNAATPGYSVVNMTRFVVARAPLLKPDLIVVGLQDGEDARELEMVSGFLFDRPLKVLGRASYLVEAIRGQVREPDAGEKRRALLRQSMEAIQTFCSKTKIELVVIDILTRGGTPWCIQEIDKVCEAHSPFEFSGSVLHTAPALIAEPKSPYLYEHHLNRRGHEVVGRLLADYVLEKVMSRR